MLWLGSTRWQAVHQRMAKLRPADRSCAATGTASNAEANASAIDLRIPFPVVMRPLPGGRSPVSGGTSEVDEPDAKNASGPS